MSVESWFTRCVCERERERERESRCSRRPREVLRHSNSEELSRYRDRDSECDCGTAGRARAIVRVSRSAQSAILLEGISEEDGYRSPVAGAGQSS